LKKAVSPTLADPRGSGDADIYADSEQDSSRLDNEVDGINVSDSDEEANDDDDTATL